MHKITDDKQLEMSPQESHRLSNDWTLYSTMSDHFQLEDVYYKDYRK